MIALSWLPANHNKFAKYHLAEEEYSGRLLCGRTVPIDAEMPIQEALRALVNEPIETGATA